MLPCYLAYDVWRSENETRSAWCLRAASLYSTDLSRYVIFGRAVRSPCDGTIVATVDGLVDNIPPRSDRGKRTGNHVVVACHGVRVFLAHLQRGSVSVQPGAAVASAGTDGTARAGSPVPILFDGTFAVRNTVLRDTD